MNDKVQISEANVIQAMKSVYQDIINLYPNAKEFLDYTPKDKESGEAWLRDNKVAGLLYLKKHKLVKEAWVIVRFESHKNKVFGQHTVFNNNKKITSPEEFKEFFGVAPSADFDFTSDMTIYVRWDKEQKQNKYANRDLDETAPNFYMYTNHRSVNLESLMQRLERINELVDKDPSIIKNGVFNIPIKYTNIKN